MYNDSHLQFYNDWSVTFYVEQAGLGLLGDPPASAYGLLGLQVHISTPGFHTNIIRGILNVR